jgi:hypothetical protein
MSVLLALIILFTGVGQVCAQTTGNALFDFGAGAAAVTTNTTGVNVSNMTSVNNNGTVTVIDNSSASSGYTGASGTYNIGNATPGGGFNAATNGYFELTLTPPAGTQLKVTGISFGSRSTSTGPVNYIIRSSADGYSANLAAGTLTANSAWTLIAPAFTSVTAGGGTPLTIRIYGYNGSGANANTTVWRLDDISITSTLVNVVPPTITSFSVSPNTGTLTSGYVGSTITVTGSGFTGVNTVKVASTTVTNFTVVDDNTISFPAIAASGAITVQNTAGTANTGTTTYTNNGYITTQGGDYASASTWLGGSLPTGGTVNVAHAITVSTSIVNAPSWLRINAGGSLTFNNAAGSLTATTINIYNGGSIAWTAAGTLTVASTGTISNVGTFSAGPGTVVFTGTGSTNGAITFNNLTINGVTTLVTAPTINGTLLFNSPAATVDRAPNYGPSSLLKYSTGVAGQPRGPEWSTSANGGFPINVQISGNTTLSPAANSKNNTPLNISKDLTIDAGSSLYMDYNGNNMSMPLIIGGNLNLTGNLSGSQTSGSNITISGNWTNNGTAANFFPNDRPVIFKGTTAQAIGGTNANAPAFDSLTINNSAGVSLAISAKVNNNLTLINGLLKLGGYNLTLSSGATTSTPSSLSYVQTNGTGQLVQTVGSSQVIFAVGNSSYNPLKLTNAGTIDTYGISVADGPFSGVYDASKIVNRRWFVTEGTSGGSNLTVIAQYNTGETGSGYTPSSPVYLALYNSAAWTENLATVNGSNPYTVTSGTAFTNSLPTSGTASYFAIGNENSLIATPAITGMSPAAKYEGDLAFSLIVTGTNFINESTVMWNGSPRTTTFNSSTQLTAAIPMSDIATAGTANVAVATTGLPTSNTVVFTINKAIDPNVQTTSPATAITTTSAVLSGNLSAKGNPDVKDYGILYAQTSNNATPIISDTVAGVIKLTVTTASVVGAYSFNPASLSVNTQYTFRAYATNDNDFFKYVYGLPVNFYTLANVPAAPTVNGATSMTLNVAVNENGNPSNTEYAIFESGGKYVQADGSLGTTAVWQTAAAWGTKTVTGLSSSTTYTFSVKARNGDNVATTFSATANGTTATCALPTNLTVSDITNSGAAISWNSSGSTDYEYAVSISSTPPASGTPLSATSEFVSGLNSSTNYYLHVRAKCGSNFSSWVTSDPFTTLDPPSGIVTWIPNGQSNFGVSPWTPTTTNSNLIATGLTRGSGVQTGTNVAAASNAWGGYGWQGDPTQDLSFTLKPKTGFVVNLSSLSLSYRRSTTGPSSGTLSYSLDGGSSYKPISTFNFTTGVTGYTIAPIKLDTIPALQNIDENTSIKFRILPLGGDQKGTWYLYNQGLVLTGNLSPIVTVPTATAATNRSPACFTANWNPVPTATKYYLYVSTPGLGIASDSTLLAGWDFTSSLNSNLGITGNLGIPIKAVGTNAAALQSNATVRADGWDGGNGTKYWEISFSTQYYKKIRVFSTQRSSNAGPANFRLQYKIGAGGTYADVPGATVTVANDYTTGILKNISLPSDCDSQKTVYLRWLMNADTAVTGGAVSNLGASNINDIKIYGFAVMNSVYVPGYEKKDVGTSTSPQVTGLNANTVYYYEVRSVVSGVTSNLSTRVTTSTIDYTTADYRSKQPGNWSSASTWQYDLGCNQNWVDATAPPGATNNVSIQSGHTVTLDANVTIGSGKTLTVNSGGVLATGSYTVSGAGAFTLASGGTLSIGSSAGITASAASGNIQVTGARSYNAGGNYIYAGTTNQVTGDGLPASVYTLSINNTGPTGNNVVTLSRSGTTTLSCPTNPSLVLTKGLLTLGTGNTLSIADGGGISAATGNFNSVAAASAGTISFAGTGTVSGTIDFYPAVVINGGLDFGTASTIRNSLQLNTGSFVFPNVPTYATNSTLIYNNGTGNYQRNAEWATGTSGPGVPYNVTVQNNTTLFFDYNNASAGDRYLTGNLTLGTSLGAGSLDMGAMNKKIVVGDNLVIGGTTGTSTLKLSTAIGGDVQVNGHWTRNNTGVFTANNRAVFLNGAGPTTITAPTPEAFDYLYINKTAGATVNLSTNIQVNGLLNFTSGNLVTGTNKALVSATGTVSGAQQNTGWVVGNLQRYIGTGAVNQTFDIGDAANYRPVNLSFSNVTTAGSLLVFVSQSASEHPDVDNSGINKTKDLNRYYSLTPVGLGISGTYDVTFHYLPSDIDPGAAQANFVVRRYNGLAWNSFSSEVNSANATKVSVSQLSATNEFVIGECKTADVSNLTLSAAATCAGAKAAITITSTSLAPDTYTVTYDLGAPNAVSNQTATVTLSGSGTVSGTFQTPVLSAGGVTTLTIKSIQATGTLQCSPALSSPSNTVDINVALLSTAPSGIMASNTVSCSGGSTTLTVNGGALGTNATWQWYAGTCGGTPVGTGPSITVSPTATTTYFVRAEGGCGPTTCASIVITYSTSNTWTGNATTDWNTAANWACNLIPPAGYDVVIPSSAFNGHFPVLSADVSIGSVTINAPATVSLNGKTLTISNSVSGTGTFTGNPSSALIINGGTSTLYFTQAADADYSLGSLTVNGGNITLGSKLNLYSLLDIAAPAASLNLSGQALVLKSTETETARVAEIKGSLTGATNVTVERYIPNYNNLRRWRLVTSPVEGTTINAAWQEGRRWDGNGAEPGAYGTLITGQQQRNATTANSNGFDFWPAIYNSSASIRRYAGAPASGNALWQPLSNTLSPKAFDTCQAYLLFVRGDRTISSTGVTAATLRATGLLRQGTRTLTLYGTGAQSFTLIGNPYPSPLDFQAVYSDPANSGKLKQWFWLYSARQGPASGFGAYQLVIGFPDGSYEALPTPFSQANHGNADQASRVIASGSGMFVVPVNAANSTLTLKESHKAAVAPTVSVFRTATPVKPVQKLYVNLSEKTIGSGSENQLLDGVLARWDDTYTTTLNDVQKAVNSGENLSLQRDTNSLMVFSNPAVRAGDTLRLKLWNTSQKTYLLEVKAMNLALTGLTAFLIDQYKKKTIPLSLTGTITPVEFTVTAEAGSNDPGRFLIVFRQGTVLPLIVSSIRAVEKNSGIEIEWKVENEEGIRGYELEKSAGGQDFQKLAEFPARAATGQQTYTQFDAQPLPVNYYRVKTFGLNGQIRYSAVVKLAFHQAEAFAIYPNPVTGRSFQLQLVNKPAGAYTLSIYNAIGQKVLQKQISHAGGTATAIIPLSQEKQWAAGTYWLELRSPGGKTETLKLQLMNE